METDSEPSAGAAVASRAQSGDSVSSPRSGGLPGSATEGSAEPVRGPVALTRRFANRFNALPLWAQIVGWFFLNLLLLGLLACALLFSEFEWLLGALLEGRAGHRLSALSGEFTDEISSQPRPQWESFLSQWSTRLGMPCALFREDGAWMAGEVPRPPVSVLSRMRVARPRPPNRDVAGQRPPPPPPPESSGRHFVLKEEGLYWIGVRLGPFWDERGQRGPAMLLLVSPTVRAGGLLLESKPWWVAGAVLLGSALFWVPLVRRMTASLAAMRDAAEQMAAGKFETRVPLRERGRDELGNLAESLNHLGSQLENFVHGQKRFLGDVAHELCSPLARMEWSLGVLEQKAGPSLEAELQDVREEVALLSQLVEELLCFSRAGLHEGFSPERIDLRALVESAARREGVPASRLLNRVGEGLEVCADRKLLERAVANVLRNALRYSGEALPIHLEARREEREIILAFADEGPGVPEEAVHRLCEPFFRPETARTRETGGSGLGLAIVKRVLEASGGSVRIQNRKPSGLLVEFVFPNPLFPGLGGERER
jgi:two-component system sensor histidine kinase CpxA